MNLRQKPNGVWLVDFEDDTGARRRVSTGTKDKATAKQKARDIVLGLDLKPAPTRGDTPATPTGFTMDDLFRKCELTVWSPREAKSQGTIKSNLKILREKIGTVLVTDMNFTRIDQLKNDLFAAGYAAGTVKRKLDMVGKALTMATKWTDAAGRPYLSGKPAMPTITTRNSRDRFLADREEAAVFKAIDTRVAAEPTRDWKRFRVLIRFLLDTGCRLGEALGAKIEHFESREIEERTVWFVTFPRYTTKNDKPRTLPLTDAVASELDFLRMMAAPDGRVFPLKPATAWYMWDNLRADLKAEDMDLSDVVLHTMRHTCLTRLAKRLPIHKVSQWAGHSSVQVTMDHYAHLQSEDLMDGWKVLSAA